MIGKSLASVLLLTRFNCRFAASWTKVALDPKWLGLRFCLFERYCLPSVLAQDCPNFKWLLFFDDETPEPFRERAANLLRENNVVPVFVRTLSAEVIHQTIMQHLRPEARYVITTRLDNDDGLATDFVRRLIEAFAPTNAKEYLNFSEGFILCKGRVYRRRDPHNAFVSLVEPADGLIEGVWTYPHTEIHQHAKVRQLGDGPGWLQVVHGGNVTNRVRGCRVPPTEIDGRFVLDRSELAPSCGPIYWWERKIMSRVWGLRDVVAEIYRMGKRRVGRGWKVS